MTRKGLKNKKFGLYYYAAKLRQFGIMEHTLAPVWTINLLCSISVCFVALDEGSTHLCTNLPLTARADGSNSTEGARAAVCIPHNRLASVSLHLAA